VKGEFSREEGDWFKISVLIFRGRGGEVEIYIDRIWGGG